MPIDYGKLIDEDTAAQAPESDTGLGSVATDTFGTYQNPAPKLLEPTPPAAPEPADYGKLMDEDLSQQEAARNTVLDLAVPVNPDKAARSQELAKRYKVRVEAVDAEFDLIDRKARVEDLRDMARESPLLLQRLTDPTFAKVAHDDVGVLATVEARLKQLAEVPKVLGASALDAASGVLGGVLRIPEAAARVREERVAKASEQPWYLQDTRRLENDKAFGSIMRFVADKMGATAAADSFAAARAERAQDPEALSGGYVLSSELSTRTEQAWEQAKEGNLTPIGEVLTDPRAWANALGGAIPSLIAAIYLRLPGVMVLEGGGALDQAAAFEKREGVTIPAGDAMQSAAQTAVGSGLLEKYGATQVLAAFKSKKFWKALAAVGGEAGTETLQTLNQNLSVIFSYDTDQKIDEGVLQSAMGGAAASSAILSVSAAAGVGKEKETTNQNTEALKQLLELDSKLSKRAPQVFSQFVDEAAKGGVESVYVDATTLQQQAQEAKIDLAKAMPETAARLQDALDTSSAVRIPIGEFVAAVQGTTLAQSLLPLTRIGDPNAATQQELSDGQRASEVQAETEKIIAALSSDAAFVESTAVVEREFQTQLQTANRFTSDVNNANARVTATAYAVLASRLKATGKPEYADLTPELAYAKFPINITAEQPDVGQKLDQPTSREDGSTYNPQTGLWADPAVLNVGLVASEKMGGLAPTIEEITAALGEIGVKVLRSETLRSQTEETFVPTLSRPLAEDELHALSVRLRQEAISQRTGKGVGMLAGPHAELWGGAYKDEYFQSPGGPPNAAPGRAPAPRAQGVPATAFSISTARDTTALKGHPDYAAAKSGDVAAAVRLVQDLVRPEDLAAAREKFGEGAVYAYPQAEEATGRNAIPGVLANYYAENTGGAVEENIVQTNRAFHTGAKMMERMLSRPQFGGAVAPGRYVVVDDVSLSGSTLAELSGYIRQEGGGVVGTITLTDASRAGTIPPDEKAVALIKERFGNEIENIFGVSPDALTAEEANYLVNFRDVDALRVSVATAKQARAERLRAKGVQAGALAGDTLTGVHYSQAPRPVLDGRFAGTGIKAQERRRLDQSTDPRIRDRVDFYVGEHRREPGLGSFRHDVELHNMYDGAKNPLSIPSKDFNAFESAVIDAGFDGYYTKGRAVLLGAASHNVKTPVALRQEIAADKRLPDAVLMPDEWASETARLAPDLYARIPTGAFDSLPSSLVTKDELGGTLFQDGTFYSALLRAVENLPQERAPAADWKAIISKLPGVKKEEVDFLGVNAWLDGQVARPARIEYQVINSEDSVVMAATFKAAAEEYIANRLEKGYELREVTIPAQKAGVVTKDDLLDFIRDNEVTVENVEPTGSDFEPELVDFDDGQIIEPDEDFIKELAAERLADHLEELRRPRNSVAFTDEDGNVDEDALAEAAERNAYEDAWSIAEASAEYEYYDRNLGYRIVGNDDAGYYATTPEGVGLDRAGGYYRDFNAARDAAQEHAYDRARAEGPGGEPANKYQDYSLPGGTEYHEWLLTTPGNAGGYQDPHYDDSGQGEDTVAHVRFDAREDTTGRTTTHIAEIQSGLHQKARELRTAEIKHLMGRDSLTEAEAAKLVPKNFGYDSHPSSYAQVPNAPFKEVWPLVAIKTMIRRAVDEGHDAISWDTGDTQVSRYKGALRKAVDSIEWTKTKDGVHLVGYKNDGYANDPTGSRTEVVNTLEKESVLSDAIGKAMADKIKEDSAQTGVIEGDDITISDTGMAGFYDDILVKTVNSYVKQFGAKVGDSGVATSAPIISFEEFEAQHRKMHPDTTPEGRKGAYANYLKNKATKVHMLVITPALREAALAGQPLFQQQRASLTIPSDPTQPMTIALMKAADLSSFHHEGAHGFLEIMSRIAALPDAPVEIVEDMNKALKWFGGDITLEVWNAMSLDQKRPYHEQFARGYEMFLFEGKAPSIELDGLFARFRAWMVNVYRSLQGIKDAYTQQTGLVLPDLTDEMRGVYDRLLATDEQIKAAENARAYAPLFGTKPQGMTEDEWVAYQKTDSEATQEAVATLQTRGLRDMQWLSNARSRALKKLQKGAAEKRKAVRAEVADEVLAQPIYRAMEFLKRGVLDGEQLTGAKLSLPALKEMYGNEPNAPWRNFPTGRYSMVATEGLHPDQAAEILGFTSGDQLVRQLLEAEPARSVIAGMTDQRMLERYGDMADPASVERAANMAIHNDARGRFIATEANALAKATGQRRLLTAAAKSAAEAMIARTKVRDLRPAQYEAAEARAGRAAEKAFGKDLVEAATQKRTQLANHYAARAAYEAVEETEEKLAHLKKLGTSGARKNMRGEFLEQLDAFLERFDVRTSTTRKKQATERMALKDWLVAEAERLGAVMPDISEEMLDERTRKSYKDMTVEELRGVFDTVRQLEHLARREQKMYTTLRNLNYHAEVSAILGDFKNAYPQAFDAEGPLPYDKSYAPKLADLADKARSEFDGEFVNPENLLSVLTLDKGQQALPSLFGRLSNASDAHMAYMKRLATHLAPSADAYTFKERRAFYSKGIAVEALGGREFTKNSIASLALYWGSADGRQRIQDGFGWNETQVMAILDKLDQKDWNFVDALWRMSDEMIWPDLKALNERTKGIAPPKVEAVPYTTKFGEARGGYAPLVYDGEVDSRSQSLNNDDAVHELLGGTARQAVTRQSASKGRVEKVTRKLDLSLASFTYKINETVHDITHREAVADTWRLLQSKRIGNAVRTIGGPAVLEALMRRVRETAVKPIVPTGFTTKALWLLRRNTLINMMGLSFNTVAINVLGTAPAMREVGPVRFARAAAKFANPATAGKYFDFIMEKSQYMVHRPMGFDRDMNTEMSRFTTKSTIMPSMATWFVGLAMMDRAVTLPTWLAAYEKHMEEGPVPNDITASVEAADRAVRRTQGGGRKIDLADIAGGTGAAGEFKHLITMYYNFFSAQLGQMVLSQRIAKAQFNEGQRAKAAVNLTLATLSVVVIPAVLEALARGTCDESADPAEWAGCLTRQSVFFTANFVPLARDVIPFAWSKFDPEVINFGVRLSPVVNALETLGGVPKAMYDFGQGEANESDYRTLVRGTGYAFGLPGFQAWRTLDGYQALVEGESDDLTDLLTGPEYKK